MGDEDVLLGLLDDASPGTPAPVLTPGQPVPDELSPVWIAGPQFVLWQHTQLLLDVVPGRGAGSSLEAPEGVRFLTRSRVFDADEQAWPDACPAPRSRDLPAPS
ncbi:MAG: hypothetical protein JWQ53_3259 [Klenkia sp.]|nr:hypothetical protein [Klenkia sp.]